MATSHRYFKSTLSGIDTQITAILLKNITQSLPQYLFWKDTHSVYLGCNQRFAELVGLHSPEEIIGKTDHDLPWQATGHTAEFFQKTDHDAMSGHPVEKQEECLRLPNGRQIITLVSKLPIKDERQHVLGVVGYFADITELKEKERALQEAKQQAEAANRAKSLFIANMSHDLRTPLTGLLGMVEILEQEINSRQGQETVHHLLAAGQILLKLLNEIIEFSQLTSSTTWVVEEPFSLRALIQEIVQLVTPGIEQKNLRLTMHYDHRIPETLCGDTMRMKRILLNLLGNAIKFTHHGKIEMTVSSMQRRGQSAQIKIAIRDTGIGISREQQSLIFSRFGRLNPAYQGQYAGAGLGLALVRQFVTDLGGEIQVSSELGKGSVFTFTLPLQARSSESDQPNHDHDVHVKSDSTSRTTLNKASTQYRWQILLVEDNRLAQIAVQNQLITLNCEVNLASNGEEALQATRKTLYDLIFMDIGLPDIDGCEVTRQIRQQNNNLNYRTPIVALTAHLNQDDQQSCFDAGMQRMLMKPLQSDQAREILSTLAGMPLKSKSNRRKS